MQPKKLTREDKIRAAVTALIVAVLLVCILKNESQFYQLYTTPTPPKGQQLVWSTKIVFEDYDPAKGQAELRAAQVRYDRQIALEEKAAAHRAFVWRLVKWIGGFSFIAFLAIWEIRLRKAGYHPLATSRPAPTISPVILWVATIWILLIVAGVLTGKWILMVIPTPATILLIAMRRWHCPPAPPTPPPTP